MFTGSLLTVAAAELRLVFDALGLEIDSEVEQVSEGRSQFLSFSSTGSEQEIAAIIGRLSATAALFGTVEPTSDPQAGQMPSQVSDRAPLLTPIGIDDNLVFGSELVTVQRYRGKTNERFTRAMLNVALATAGISPAGIDPAEPAGGVVLDPMCGRGTTLNWALTYGLDSIGIETDASSLDQHASFIQTWAKRQRLPHNFQRFRANNGEQRCATFEVAPDRAALKSGGQTVETFSADAADAKLAIKRGSVDVIVTDLPYGVQHQGSGGQKQQHADTIELLERVLPTWLRWLRPGGAACIAWNTKRAGRREVSRVLAEAGLTPITVSGGLSMRHVVDASVDRDVIVAVR